MRLPSCLVPILVTLPSTLAQGAASPGAPQYGTVSGNIDRLTVLTRIADYITRNVVQVNNAIPVRHDTIAIINAIGERASADLAGLNKRATLSAAEQNDVAGNYSTFLEVTNSFLGATVEKHLAVVAHSAAHSMGTAMNSTFGILSEWSDAIMAAAPAQKTLLTNNQALFGQAYQMAVGLYLNGPNGPASA